MLLFDFGEMLSIAKIGSKNQLELHSNLVEYNPDLFEKTEKIETVLNYLYHEDSDKEKLQHEAVYISLSAGCGLQYKTFGVAQDAFLVNGSRTTKAEQQEAIVEVCKNNLSAKYTPSVINVYVTDTEYILSVGYIPTEYLDNLQSAFSNMGVSVFDIKPFGSLLYQAVNKESLGQCIVDAGDELILINSLGLIGWSKPDDFVVADNELANNYLMAQSEALYRIENTDTSLIGIKDIRPYLNADYDGEINSCVVAALALMKQQKAELKGGLSDVANKIRLFFDKRRSQEN